MIKNSSLNATIVGFAEDGIPLIKLFLTPRDTKDSAKFSQRKSSLSRLANPVFPTAGSKRESKIATIDFRNMEITRKKSNTQRESHSPTLAKTNTLVLIVIFSLEIFFFFYAHIYIFNFVFSSSDYIRNTNK